MKAIEIIVYGLPAAQGSKRHVGRGIMVESSKALAPWRETVKAAADRAMDALSVKETGGVGHYVRLDGPLVAEMTFTFERPKGHYRTGRNAHLLRDAAPVRPIGVPDVSKLVRSTEDALTDIGVWADDARVVEYTKVAKVYAGSPVLHALDRPGALIRVYPLAVTR